MIMILTLAKVHRLEQFHSLLTLAQVIAINKLKIIIIIAYLLLIIK